MVCDANILICAAEPGDVVCAPFVESPDAVIASVTRIELPGFPGFCQLAPEPQARFLRQQQQFRWNCEKLR